MNPFRFQWRLWENMYFYVSWVDRSVVICYYDLYDDACLGPLDHEMGAPKHWFAERWRFSHLLWEIWRLLDLLLVGYEGGQVYFHFLVYHYSKWFLLGLQAFQVILALFLIILMAQFLSLSSISMIKLCLVGSSYLEHFHLVNFFGLLGLNPRVVNSSWLSSIFPFAFFSSH